MICLVVGAACLLVPLTTAAGDESESGSEEVAAGRLTSKWLVVVGGSLNAFSTSAAWSPSGLAGAVIVLEDVLGLDEQTATAFVRVSHRFNRRHSIQLAISDLNRTARRTIDGDIEWGDYIFRAHGEVASELDTLIVNLKWRYDFSESDRLNAGFSAGLSTFAIGLTLRGEARLEDDTENAWVQGAVEGADVVAPVPVIGFFLQYALSPRWSLAFTTEAIDLDLGTHSGRVLETDFAVEYAFSDLFGFGFGLGGIDLRYGSDQDGERFGVAYNVKAASAYLVFSF